MQPTEYSFSLETDNGFLPDNWLAFCRDCHIQYQFIIANADNKFSNELHKSAIETDAIFINEYDVVIRKILHPVVAIYLPHLDLCYELDWRLTESEFDKLKDLVMFNPDLFVTEKDTTPLTLAYTIAEKRAELISAELKKRFAHVDGKPDVKVSRVDTIFNEHDAMNEALSATATCRYNKEKGRLAVSDRSILFVDSLFQYLGLKRPDSYSNDKSFLFELDDKFIYINDGEYTDHMIIDLKMSVIDKIESLCDGDTTYLTYKLHDKPIYVFQKQSRIIRGHDEFHGIDLPDANEDYLLRFCGYYTVDHIDYFQRVRLHRVSKQTNIPNL